MNKIHLTHKKNELFTQPKNKKTKDELMKRSSSRFFGEQNNLSPKME